MNPLLPTQRSLTGNHRKKRWSSPLPQRWHQRHTEGGGQQEGTPCHPRPVPMAHAQTPDMEALTPTPRSKRVRRAEPAASSFTPVSPHTRHMPALFPPIPNTVHGERLRQE